MKREESAKVMAMTDRIRETLIYFYLADSLIPCERGIRISKAFATVMEGRPMLESAAWAILLEHNQKRLISNPMRESGLHDLIIDLSIYQIMHGLALEKEAKRYSGNKIVNTGNGNAVYFSC